MKRSLALVGSVLLGLLVAASVYLFIGLTGIDELMPSYNKSEYNPPILWSLLFIPGGLAAGSVLIGFLIQPLIKRRNVILLLFSPGFYASVLLVLYSAYGYLRGGDWGGLEIIALLAIIIWTLVSFLGISLGFRIRTRKGSSSHTFDLRSNTTKN
jgi:hypothetical protein